MCVERRPRVRGDGKETERECVNAGAELAKAERAAIQKETLPPDCGCGARNGRRMWGETRWQSNLERDQTCRGPSVARMV